MGITLPAANCIAATDLSSRDSEIRGELRYTTRSRNPSGKWASTDWKDGAAGGRRVRDRKAGHGAPGAPLAARGGAPAVIRYSRDCKQGAWRQPANNPRTIFKASAHRNH